MLENLAYISYVLPLLAFAWKRTSRPTSGVIAFYCLYIILNEILIWYIREGRIYRVYEKAELLAYSLFTIIEYTCLSYTIYCFFERPLFKKLVYVFACIFGIVAASNLYLNLTAKEGLSELYDSIPLATSGIFLIILCILSLFEEMQNPVIGFIYITYKFWIILGIMIYFAGTFFFFLNYTAINRTDKEIFWYVNWISIIFKNIFFSIAFLMPKDDPNRELEESYFPEN